MGTAAYDVWIGLPFPEASAVDEVDEAHKDLAYWDAMTAEAVIPMVERSRPYSPGVLDFRAGLAALRERLVGLREVTSGSDAGVLDACLRYADALVAVHVWAAATNP